MHKILSLTLILALKVMSYAQGSSGPQSKTGAQSNTQSFDVIILGGTVYDGTGRAPVKAVVVGIVFWLLIGRPTSGPTTSQTVRRMTINLPDDEPLALAKFGLPHGASWGPDGLSFALDRSRHGDWDRRLHVTGTSARARGGPPKPPAPIFETMR
jgi:hypothetical protein